MRVGYTRDVSCDNLLMLTQGYMDKTNDLILDLGHNHEKFKKNLGNKDGRL